MKYIAGPDGERMHDLEHDPDELENMLNEGPDLSASWRPALEEYMGRPKGRKGQAGPRDQKTLDMLKALGYIN